MSYNIAIRGVVWDNYIAVVFHSLWQGFVGLCICLIFGVGLIGAVIMSLVVDATHKFEEAAKIGFGLCACSLIALVSVSIKPLSHYCSDQLNCPDPRQAWPIKLYTACSRPSPLAYGWVTIGHWSSRGQVNRVLISKKTFILTTLDPYMLVLTLCLLDQYPITSWSLLECWLLDRYSTFSTVKNYRVGSAIDADHPDHFCRASQISSWLLDRAWSDCQLERSFRYKSCCCCMYTKHKIYILIAVCLSVFLPGRISRSWNPVFVKFRLQNWMFFCEPLAIAAIDKKGLLTSGSARDSSAAWWIGIQ